MNSITRIGLLTTALLSTVSFAQQNEPARPFTEILPSNLKEPDYVSDFERITRDRYEATNAAIESLLRFYCSELDPLIRRATDANDLDAATRMRAALDTAMHRLQCVGRWNLENLTDGHKGTIELHGDGTLMSGLRRLGVWDIEGSNLVLHHANRGGHHDRLKLPAREGKLAGRNSMGHTIHLHRPSDPTSLANAPNTNAESIPEQSYSSPAGVWRWFIGPNVTIKDDGTVVVETDRGRWAWTDKERRGFQISWEEIQVVDSLILSADGRKISGSNTTGARVTGQRIK